MPHTNGIAITFSRPTDFTRETEWAEWYDGEHLPDTVGPATGAWVATRFESIDRPPGAAPPVGFSHMAVHEFEDIDRDGGRFLDHIDALRAGSRMHPVHTIIGLELFRIFGRWNTKPEPSADLRGHIFAYTMSNDPAVEDEWNEWYDGTHVPDMMSAGVFAATTRWERLASPRFGPRYLTLYDIAQDDVADAVARSGAIMPGLHASGRLNHHHAGGMRAALRATGRHAGRGYRADA
jgi:hypothetical protein